MNLCSAMQYLLFLGIVTTLVKPLGGYMERVFSGKRTALDRLCRLVERLIYRVGGVDSSQEMTASNYATCFLFFWRNFHATSLSDFTIAEPSCLVLSRISHHADFSGPCMVYRDQLLHNHHLASLRRRNTMTYFSQIVGLCAQNFLAGAAGLAVGIAFIRGLARQLSSTLGNPWVDVTRGLLWILLPGALAGALLTCCWERWSLRPRIGTL
jgi:K+-transporting ATPase ATPase A chain